MDELVALDVIGELTTNPAIGTYAVHRAVGKLGANVGLVHQRRRHERAGRAGLHAFAAGNAGGRSHGIVEVEHDLFAVAAPGHADHVIDLYLAAGADAQVALDAGIEVDRHGGMAAVGGRVRAAGEPARCDVLAIGGLPELGLGIVRDVLRRLIREQELDHHAPRALGAIG